MRIKTRSDPFRISPWGSALARIRKPRPQAGCPPEVPPKFRLDKTPPAPCVAGMSSSEKKPLNLVSLVIDLVLTGIAFAIFYWLVEAHVPSSDPTMVMLWGGLTAACMAGVFWIAWNMLKVVFRFQRESRK